MSKKLLGQSSFSNVIQLIKKNYNRKIYLNPSQTQKVLFWRRLGWIYGDMGHFRFDSVHFWQFLVLYSNKHTKFQVNNINRDQESHQNNQDLWEGPLILVVSNPLLCGSSDVPYTSANFRNNHISGFVQTGRRTHRYSVKQALILNNHL